ncbi:MAG: membrane protein insertion efficiency factor YidD [Microbacteriaceae bacterium]|nr:membrane protein insertion efficiency factor YidD [Microbacteriaceae bacterium]MCI1207442.1 membrane protein insertion efficiency factor YidD [Microbacteriaceae bacterium]
MLPRRAAIGFVRLWQLLVSPLYGDVCRFTPHCSAYSLEAFRRWGFVCGSALTAWRLLRCSPLSAGGFDPVPERHSSTRSERRLTLCQTSSE